MRGPERPEDGASVSADPTEPAERLFRDLRAGRGGLSLLEVERRQARYGPNRLTRRGGRTWRPLRRSPSSAVGLFRPLSGPTARAWVR